LGESSLFFSREPDDADVATRPTIAFAVRQIKSMFDMTGMNGSRDGTTVKLAGHWIPPATATSLAGAYRMGEWINVSLDGSIVVVSIKSRQS
jgi:hypothetical protein